MRLTRNLRILTIGILMFGCGLMPPRRQYIKGVRGQVIPKEILNSQWTLETFDNKASDCSLTIKFLDKGQFNFTIQGQLFKGDYLWYLVKDSRIQFHTRPIDKFAWPSFNCELKPDEFARQLSGDKEFQILDSKLILRTNGHSAFIFKKS